MTQTNLKEVLDELTGQYNHQRFIEDNPVCIPHRFTKLQDIEISGLLTAFFSFGDHRTIITNGKRLMALMNNAPYDFIRYHKPADRKPFLSIVHPLFNVIDLLFLINALQNYYSHITSLEYAFSVGLREEDRNIKNAIDSFRKILFSGDQFFRINKYPSSYRNLASLKIALYLRWMVRWDFNGVDFGLWKRISPAQLIVPVDIHKLSVAKRIGLLKSAAVNWENAVLLTNELRKFDSQDPVKYDFALLSLSAMDQF